MTNLTPPGGLHVGDAVLLSARFRSAPASLRLLLQAAGQAAAVVEPESVGILVYQYVFEVRHAGRHEVRWEADGFAEQGFFDVRQLNIRDPA